MNDVTKNGKIVREIIFQLFFYENNRHISVQETKFFLSYH